MTQAKRNRRKRIAAMKRRLYRQRILAGLVRREIWVKREDWPDLSRVIDEFKIDKGMEPCTGIAGPGSTS